MSWKGKKEMSSLIDSCRDLENEIQVREINVKNADCAVEWLTQRIRKKIGNDSLNFPADMMPKNGLAAFDDIGNLLAVAFLYIDKSSPVAVCGWCISNPKNHDKYSFSAISKIMAQMPEYAKSKGAKHLLTVFGDRGINAILDQLGFITGEVSENKFKFL